MYILINNLMNFLQIIYVLIITYLSILITILLKNIIDSIIYQKILG